MKKKIFSTLLGLAFFGVMALSCFAAEENRVVYNGKTLVNEGSNAMSGFSNMLPGKTYKGEIVLENASENDAYFYMDTSVIKTLVSTANQKDTGYTVSLTCGDTVLYGYDAISGVAKGSLIGGEGTQGLEELNAQLEEYPLAAALKPGESAVVCLSIQPDATATSSGYMGADGSIEFRFQAKDVPPIKTVEKVEIVNKGAPTVITKIRTIVQSAKTGDDAVIPVCFALMIGAAALFTAFGKKKKGE